MEVSPTFCSAHSVPEGKSSQQAADDITTNQIPALKELMDKGEVRCENVDAFCEKGVFSCDESRAVLQAGKGVGLAINFHGDELHPTNSAEMGAGIGARAIAHLEEVSEAGIEAMSNAGVVGVLLPTTAHILHLPNPPARAMITAGVAVALGSDFNPNAHCLSMPFVLNLACVQLGMTMNESLVGGTINAAAALGRGATHGSLEQGKVGDLIVLRAPSWEHLIYQLVDPPIQAVFKRGRLVSGSLPG